MLSELFDFSDCLRSKNLTANQHTPCFPSNSQRHRIAGFAAVVVMGRKRDAAQKGCGRGAGEMPFRNGRELRILLPLWQEDGEEMPLRRAVAGVARKMPFRNGTEPQVLLPLW